MAPGCGKIDTPELLSAIGTFLAAFSAFACVGVIVLRHDPHLGWILMIMAGWMVGVDHADHRRHDRPPAPLIGS